MGVHDLFKVTLRLRLLENGLSSPCLMKERVDFDQTCTAKYKLVTPQGSLAPIDL